MSQHYFHSAIPADDELGAEDKVKVCVTEITRLQKDKQDYIEENIDLKWETRLLKAKIKKLKKKKFPSRMKMPGRTGPRVERADSLKGQRHH